MELSIKEISDGAPFMADFEKVAVERCHYINVIDEHIEPTPILSHSTANILRVSNNGTIFIQVFDNNLGLEFPLVQFKVTSAFYHNDERAEVSQTAMVRGDEIIEELPISYEGLENGKVNLFMISKQQGKTIAFLILNPKGIDEYYYRITFKEA